MATEPEPIDGLLADVAAFAPGLGGFLALSAQRLRDGRATPAERVQLERIIHLAEQLTAGLKVAAAADDGALVRSLLPKPAEARA